MNYTAHELALLSGVTVRTLHHYDQVGLLSPSRNERNGYRRYSKDDLMRLQQILFFRELEFPLVEIKKIMSSKKFDMRIALKDHRQLIKLKMDRLSKLIKTIDKTMQNIDDNKEPKDSELYESFSTSEVDEYAKEAKERWGHTDAYKESQKRVKAMGKAGLDEVARKSDELMKEIVAAMPEGPASETVQKLIERHYDGLRAFYEPNLQMYRGLANMYVDDPRFTKYYENYAPGLAKFMKEAMTHYVENRG